MEDQYSLLLVEEVELICGATSDLFPNFQGHFSNPQSLLA